MKVVVLEYVMHAHVVEQLSISLSILNNNMANKKSRIHNAQMCTHPAAQKNVENF
jgi:hypothetical protein